MKRNTVFSLVLACYNEGPTFLASLKKLRELLEDLPYGYEIICIDDASKDETLHTLTKFAKPYKNIRVISHKNNVGRGGTVKEGILMAKGKFVGYIDVDLEISAIYIPDFIRTLKKGADVVIAQRVYQENIGSMPRWLASKLYIILVRHLLDLPFKDTEAGYKFFKRSTIIAVLKRTRDKKWFFDTEIIARSHKSKLVIEEIPVLFMRRADKKSTVRLIPDTIAYIKAINKYKRNL